jgi:hypothetical protein
MTQMGNRYAQRYLDAEIDLDFAFRKLRSTKLKQQFCTWFIDRMIDADIRPDDCYPPAKQSPQVIYQAISTLLLHGYFALHAIKPLLRACESSAEDALKILGNVCSKNTLITQKLIAQLNTTDFVHSAHALSHLLEAGGQLFWLDAAKTTKTKKELYQFTKWPSVLSELPRHERGQILEGDLGL